MRDVLVVGLVLLGALIALRRPWVGVMLWTWLSIMNPHRYTWSFAYDAPLAAIAAASTLVGLAITKDKRESPVKGPPVVILILFMVWITLSWLFGMDPRDDSEQWSKVMKVDFMVLVSLALLHSKRHIFAMAWVCAASLALLGAKGGLFTVLSGGAHRVWGPAGTFIADNNHFALALIMTIPLLRFLQLQLVSTLGRHALTIIMVLVAAAALGSHSRGALLAIFAMSLLLWWWGRSRILGGIVLVSVALSLLAFMPEQWSDRMGSIAQYQQDASALGRISAWAVAWHSAFQFPLGVGFNAARPELFAAYSPYPELGVFAAHSIYFQILGNHGFIGLALYLLLWIATWRSASSIRRESKGIPEARWCADLASMCQVSLLGFAAGGAFLSMSYFDLPYNILALVVLTRAWVRSKAWETEPAYRASWLNIPGLAQVAQAR